eukprot:CAMPEP_0172923220 /NCGR_PEP_ID=MMETSP1075-20121228/209317_1 /TAXON_ID=2916 /ORGANISM="Ceratium fusus, Strain PA161109" /LENGTH=36 /DNA_ID= /DNA_START= /DNA_END= /DNA_ORIENTATION=
MYDEPASEVTVSLQASAAEVTELRTCEAIGSLEGVP